MLLWVWQQASKLALGCYGCKFRRGCPREEVTSDCCWDTWLELHWSVLTSSREGSEEGRQTVKHHDRELTLFLSSAVRLSLYRSSTVFHFVIRSAVEKSLRFNSDSFSASVFFFFSFCGNVAAVGRRGVTDVEKVFTEAHKGSQYRWGSVTFTRWRLSERRGPWDSGDRPPDTVRALYSWQVKMMKYAFLVAENTESVRRQRRCP